MADVRVRIVKDRIVGAERPWVVFVQSPLASELHLWRRVCQFTTWERALWWVTGVQPHSPFSTFALGWAIAERISASSAR